ncbi:hypothetical protein [Noviherbaspirillum agri]
MKIPIVVLAIEALPLERIDNAGWSVVQAHLYALNAWRVVLSISLPSSAIHAGERGGQGAKRTLCAGRCRTAIVLAGAGPKLAPLSQKAVPVCLVMYALASIFALIVVPGVASSVFAQVTEQQAADRQRQADAFATQLQLQQTQRHLQQMQVQRELDQQRLQSDLRQQQQLLQQKVEQQRLQQEIDRLHR